MAVDTWSHQIDKTQWHHYKTCSCGGTLKHKYRNATIPALELHIMPNRGKFNIFEGHFMKAGDLISKLKETLETVLK